MTTAAQLLDQPFATMPEMNRAHAVERPAHIALGDGERTLTFAQFDALVDRAAAALQRDMKIWGPIVKSIGFTADS